MERLTTPTLKQNFKHCVDAWSAELLRKEYWHIYDRLAAYEDTGLTPEEVNACKHALMGREIAKITEFEGISLDRLEEICNAERDGRCYTPPVKIGDTVYWCSRFGNAIYQGKVYEIKISSFGFDLELRTAENQRFLRESEKCYFTREAAEAALKERE